MLEGVGSGWCLEWSGVEWAKVSRPVFFLRLRGGKGMEGKGRLTEF